MDALKVGVCQVHLFLRHAQNLKDRRQILNGLKQKLKNQGFTVSEHPSDNPKHANIGFAFAGYDTGTVEHAIEEGLRLFWGLENTVTREIFDFPFEQSTEIPVSERFPDGD